MVQKGSRANLWTKLSFRRPDFMPGNNLDMEFEKKMIWHGPKISWTSPGLRPLMGFSLPSQLADLVNDVRKILMQKKRQKESFH